LFKGHVEREVLRIKMTVILVSHCVHVESMMQLEVKNVRRLASCPGHGVTKSSFVMSLFLRHVQQHLICP